MTEVIDTQSLFEDGYAAVAVDSDSQSLSVMNSWDIVVINGHV